MHRIQRYAVLLDLCSKLGEKGSWCGETHIQKTCYFLQHFMTVPLRFQFILYKYGPFSFDLNAELPNMVSRRLLSLVPRPPYGPSLELTPIGRRFRSRFPKTLSRYEQQNDFIASEVGTCGVKELEGLATALYVTLASPAESDPEALVKTFRKIKPHLGIRAARDALQSLDDLKVKLSASKKKWTSSKGEKRNRLAASHQSKP